MYNRFLKVVFDILFGILLGVIAIPILLLTIIFVFIVSPKSGSPIFIQERIGYKCKKFRILKVRTMTNEKDENGDLLPDAQRLKWWGKIIRKTNVDELMQIVHILSGQMSFVGPRPLLPKEMLVMTNNEQQKRQSVKPGIVGWESVNESKSKSRYEMSQFDLYYVENISMKLDLKIVFLTVIGIFKRPDDSFRAPKVSDEEIENARIKDQNENGGAYGDR